MTVRPAGPLRVLTARFRLPVLILLAGLAYGTVGYIVIERWSILDSLYMTVITLSTVGFSEVHPLDAPGRIFTITLAIVGVTLLFALIGVLAQLMSSGELAEPLRRRRMTRRIDELNDHYVICAYGRVGRAAAEELDQQGIGYVVIEKLPELIPLMEEHGVTYLSSDPTEESVLKEAGIDRARGLVCAVDSDAINVYITLSARALNPKLSIVSRASAPESVDKLMRAGADRVVSPYVLSGKRMAALALQPSVVEFFDMVTVAPDLRLEEIVIRPHSPLVGRTIGQAYERFGEATILAVKKLGADLVPSPSNDVVISAGDLIVVLGPLKTLTEMAS